MTLEEQLIRDEGLRLKPYTDSRGKLTIGVGRNLTDVGISEGEAMDMLEHDLGVVEQGLALTLTWATRLDHPRWCVLVNMAFNLGLGGLLKFKKMIAAVKSGDYHLAAVEMLDSEWAKQVGPRARRLAAQMEYGEWQ